MTTYRIKDIAYINRKTLSEHTDPEKTFRYIDIRSINEFGKINIPNERITFAAAPSRARRLAPPDSVVVSTVRTYLRAIASVPTTKDQLVFSTGFAVLEAGPKVDARYLAYYCHSQAFVDEVVARSVGVSYPAINASEIGNIPIKLPSIDEQHRIADFLDREIDHIAHLIAKRKRQISLLNEYALAHVSETLVPGTFSNSRRSKNWPWLPTLPEHIPLVRLGYICKLQNGFTLDSNQQSGKDAVTRPYLRVANVQAGALALDEVSEVTVSRRVAARCTLKRGDVLMTEGGDLDKLGRGTVWREEIPNCLHQNHVFALRPDREKLHSDYLALMTRTLHGRCYFESTGVKTTNLASTNSSKILDFPIPLPDLKTQIRLSTQLLADLESIANTKDAIRRQLGLLTERKQALITAAVTGQIDVTTARGVEVS